MPCLMPIEEHTETTEKEKVAMKMKKYGIVCICLVLLTVCLLVLPTPAEAASNKCGDNLTWKISSSGTLTISGTGPMYEWGPGSDAPWYARRDSIKKVEIQEGVTTIGDSAFRNYNNLTSVSIPNTVTEIGEAAFEWCSNITSIVIPDSVTVIGDRAFDYCDNMVIGDFIYKTRIF